MTQHSKNTAFFAALAAAALFCAGVALPAAAQLPAGGSSAPVDISAAQSLEWDSRARTYTARKDVLVKQGALEIRSQLLTAHYDAAGGNTDIRRLVAEDGVTIFSAPYTAYGDRAVYDVATQTATLTGENLRIATPAETLSARDKIEYDAGANRLDAVGQATATRGTDRLESAALSAFFKQDAGGKTVLDRIVSATPVTIRTARETVTGDRGDYNVTTGKATLTGNVKIRQGDSFIEGTRAEVDLATGVSRLFADTPAGGDAGRVRGVFYPKQKTATP